MGEPKEEPPNLDVLIFMMAMAAVFTPIAKWHGAITIEAGFLFLRFRRKLRPRTRMKALAASRPWPSEWKRPDK
jgi:hypothetical protein